MARPAKLSTSQIQLAFNEDDRKRFGPILTPDDFAELFRISRSTAYLWISKGRLKDAVTKIGKHRLILRDRSIEVLFQSNQQQEITYDPND